MGRPRWHRRLSSAGPEGSGLGQAAPCMPPPGTSGEPHSEASPRGARQFSLEFGASTKLHAVSAARCCSMLRHCGCAAVCLSVCLSATFCRSVPTRLVGRLALPVVSKFVHAGRVFVSPCLFVCMCGSSASKLHQQRLLSLSTASGSPLQTPCRHRRCRRRA
jgi:hypothetical protein